jgi:hypothetical protein
MVVVRQGRDQVAEHVGRRRKSVKQEQRRRRGGARFPVEDVQAIHVDEAVPRRAGRVRQGRFHGYPPAHANASLPTSGSRRRKSSQSPGPSPRRALASAGHSVLLTLTIEDRLRRPNYWCLGSGGGGSPSAVVVNGHRCRIITMVGRQRRTGGSLTARGHAGSQRAAGRPRAPRTTSS